jgi:biopolymer transport protein TolR
MAMSTGGTGSGPTSDINMTPMIDVLLVLLIIFLVIQPALQKGIKVEVPAVRQAEVTEQPDQVVLRVGPGPTYRINGEEVRLEEIGPGLQAIFADRQDERVLFVDASETLSYGEVVRAIDQARGAQVEVVGLVPRSERDRIAGALEP